MKDLTTFTLSVIQELEDEGRFGTAHVYRSMLRAFNGTGKVNIQKTNTHAESV